MKRQDTDLPSGTQSLVCTRSTSSPPEVILVPRMLRTLRHSSSVPTLRRLLAAVLALCVSVAFAEPMIADDCDGASRSAMVLHAGDVDAAAAQLMSVVGSDTPSDDAPASDQHTVHLCHCAHAHVGTLADVHTILEDVQMVSEIMVREAAQIPPSVSGEPQLRPPRLLTA